jgi:uncharacterized protein (TIGR02147 family)
MKNIFDFLHYRDFLKYWFEKKKSEKSTYSYRVFARQIKQKSPSFLKDVIENRRNINLKYFDIITKTLGLHRREKNYFRQLIILDQSKDRAERKHAFELISAIRRLSGARIIEG